MVDFQARFAADLGALAPSGAAVGLAVSGGSDSLALLALALDARGAAGVRVATVDHRLQPGSAAVAAGVAERCAALEVACDVLALDWPAPPTRGVQAAAREARYAALGGWAGAHGLRFIATAHHADDQAETLLMRVRRGAGLAGLAGIRATRALADGVRLIRPLLGWRRGDLAAVVAAAGWTAHDDPANADPRHERSRARALLGREPWLDPARLADSARWLAEAEAAAQWTIDRLADGRLVKADGGVVIDMDDLPAEWRRRLLLRGYDALGRARPRGPDLVRADAVLTGGGRCTLGGLLLRADGPRWHMVPAPKMRQRRSIAINEPRPT